MIKQFSKLGWLVLLLAMITFNVNAQQCVTWYNGISSNDSINLAANALCSIGIIPSAQDVTAVYNTPVSKKEVAKLAFNSLFGSGSSAPSDYFPTPFIDISFLSSDYQQACKAMLYLDYGDGIAPFSRDYYFVNAELPFQKKGECIRALLEAWNIQPYWNGYDAQANTISSFYTDVQVNDPNYGWIQQAYLMGMLNDLPQSICSNTCFQPSVPYSKGQVYVMLYRLLAYHQFPSLSANSFFYPNNFTASNINNQAGIDRAVFSNYEAPVFNISGGGLPLTFAQSYRSDLTELPFIPDEYSLNDYNLQIQAMFPLGVGWTHSYNISIISIKNYVGGAFNEENLAVRWADGSVDMYDRLHQNYLTPGVKDQLTVLAQNSNGFAQVIEIVKPNGLKYHFELEPLMGLLRLYSITDRNNNSLALSYQPGYGIYSPLRLSQVTDNVSNRSLTFSYAAGSNFISSVSDPIGRTIYFNVDGAANDLLSFFNGNGLPTNYQYDPGVYKHLLTRIQKPNGNYIDNTYQARKLNQSQNGSYVVQVSFSANYLANGQTSTSQVSTFNNGQALDVNYSQDSRGNPTRILSPTKDISISYDTIFPDLPSYVTDNNTGISHSYVYDNRGNTIYSGTISNNIVLAETSTYNSFNDVVQHTDANGNITNYLYDNNGNLTGIEEPNNVVTSFTINTNGNVIKKVDPSNIATDYFYNQFGNLNRIQLEGLPITASAAYDGASRITSVTNSNSITTQYSYNNNNGLSDEYVDPSGLNLNTHYTYDNNDNVIDIRDPRQLHTSLFYDFNTDDLLTETYGPYSRNWTYNTDGTLNAFTSKNNFVFNHSYYPSGDLRAGLLQSDGYSNYDYNLATRQVSSVTRGGYQLNYGYDAFQRTNSISSNDLPYNTVSYDYDNVGNVVKITYPFNTNWYITYEWNANNRLTGIKDWNSVYLAKYFYRKNGQLEHEEFGNGTATYYVYDTVGRLDSIYTIASNTLIVASGATLDNVGNHTRESYYVYLNDTAGLVTRDPVIPLAYNYSTINRLDNTDQGSFGYDNNGNLLSNSNPAIQFVWDEKDKLQSFVTPQTTHFYEYDPLENRRRFDTTRYAIDILGQSNVLSETDLNGNPKVLYVHGLGLICRIDISTGKVFYYHYDFRGSTIAITDDSAKVIAEYEYDPFGAIIAEKDPPFHNPFTYVGKSGIMTDDTDMYYMRARYYQPSLGRFISEDPIWNCNLFPYAGNNPISNIDPSGGDWVSWVPVIGSGRDAYQSFKKGNYGWGLVNTGLALLDLTGVEALAEIGAKALIESAGKEAIAKYSFELTEENLHQHIIPRHWSTSTALNAGKFSEETTIEDLKGMIQKTLDNGTRKPNTENRAGEIVEHSFEKIIGKNGNGKLTSRLRVILLEGRIIKSVFPF